MICPNCRKEIADIPISARFASASGGGGRCRRVGPKRLMRSSPIKNRRRVRWLG